MSAIPPYTSDELAGNDSFRRWVLSGNTDDEKAWECWLVEHPEKRELVEESTRLLLESQKVFNRISNEEIEVELSRLDASIDREPMRLLSRSQLLWMFRAACLVVAVIGGWRIFYYPLTRGRVSDFALSIPLEHVIRSTDAPVPTYLPDGSTVVLQPGSELQYGAGFGDSLRVVFLKGEAFFDVKRDVTKPFLVYSGNVLTKVLGTSFTISAFQSVKNVTVSVKTGRVSVFPLRGKKRDWEGIMKDGMILTANQELVYEADELKVTRRLVEDPEIVEFPAPGRLFDFNNTPASEVLETLAAAYGVEILFDRDVIRLCYLTARLDKEPLFEKLDLICRTIGAGYEQLDGAIIVTSHGCL
jgi:transmembrane sensor